MSSETLSALAWAAGSLQDARTVAKSVGLAAMNAHVLASRAGDTARAFGPITAAVGDLATEVAAIVDELGATASAATMSAAKLFVMTQRARHFDDPRLHQPRLDEHLLRARREMARRVSRRHRAYVTATRAFIAELDRIDAALRASHTLAILARIEAARTTSGAGALTSIATTLDEAARQITALTQRSRDRLDAAGIG